jgi:hypothetical protein
LIKTVSKESVNKTELGDISLKKIIKIKRLAMQGTDTILI